MPTSYPQSVSGSSSSSRLPGNIRRKRSVFHNTLMMMIHNDDDHNDNKKSLRRTATFVRRKWIESTTKRPQNWLEAFHIRFRMTALQMLDMPKNGICSHSSSSSALNLSGMSSSTRASSAAPAETLIVATLSSTASIQQQITDHVVQISADNSIGDFDSRIQEHEVSSTTISTPSTTTSSVHLQLTDPTLLRQEAKDDVVEETCSTDDTSKKENSAIVTSKPQFGTTTVVVHTYNDTTTNQTWKALNISRRKFRSYLQYCEVWNNTTTKHTNNISHIDDYFGIVTVHQSILSSSPTKSKPTLDGKNNDAVTKSDISAEQDLQNKEQLHNVTSQLRDEWRALWKTGRLITDRTELLAVYPSDLKPGTNDAEQENIDDTTTQVGTATNENQVQQSKPKKRGGFADLLLLYTDRLMAILRDEHDDIDHDHNSKTSPGQQSMDIVHWLEKNYGQSETQDLLFENFQLFDESTKLIKLKHFLEWFRSQFPYFYDRCDTCGASIKEDLAKNAAANVVSDPSDTTASDEATNTANELADVNQVTPDESNITLDNAALNEDETNRTEDDIKDDSDDVESEHQTFVGYVYPNNTELVGKASRTELYQCHQCASFTRFPRYNAAQFVLSQKRGRCGEYSMLLYRFFRALHHECRWVVDWADHVWVEVLIQSSNDNARWIHLDPCEAAVDENFIYQGWGKKQNYIVGFYLPTMNNMKASLQHLSERRDQVMNNGTLIASSNISYIEDITHCYTKEEWGDVCQRRDESEAHIQASIVKATHELQNKLLQYYNFTATATLTPNAAITK